jgi:hypothetical protein
LLIFSNPETAFLGTLCAAPVDSKSPLIAGWIMAMTEPQTTNTRRSSRVFTRIPVRASGKNTDGKKFRENTQTIVINAHGGLLYLQEPLEMGSDVVLINPVTEEEQECRVVYVGDTSDKGTRIGVEFLSPSPHFWGVEFAPQDWPARPSTRPVH